MPFNHRSLDTLMNIIPLLLVFCNQDKFVTLPNLSYYLIKKSNAKMKGHLLTQEGSLLFFFSHLEIIHNLISFIFLNLLVMHSRFLLISFLLTLLQGLTFDDLRVALILE